MNTLLNKICPLRSILHGVSAWSAAVLMLASGCSTMDQSLDMEPIGKVSLSAASEIPPAKSEASGSGSIKVATDRTVSGSIETFGMAGTAAHIHLAPKGSNGPVIVSLIYTGENIWSVPDGVKLTDTQYASYVMGDMYVNIHSETFPGGEIRSQLSPN